MLQRWAAVLMGPQHAGQVSAAYAKKIEAIAKQPAWWVCGSWGEHCLIYHAVSSDCKSEQDNLPLQLS